MGHAERRTWGRGVRAEADFRSLPRNEDSRLAIERRIEIIGEAARRVSPAFKEAHPQIPWRLIVDQRNVLIHAYDEIADDRIWALAIRNIPQLIEQLEVLLPDPDLDPPQTSTP